MFIAFHFPQRRLSLSKKSRSALKTERECGERLSITAGHGLARSLISNAVVPYYEINTLFAVQHYNTSYSVSGSFASDEANECLLLFWLLLLLVVALGCHGFRKKLDHVAQ